MSAIIGTPQTPTPNHTYTDESIIGHYGVTNVLGRLIMMANLDFCGKNYDSKTLHVINTNSSLSAMFQENRLFGSF